MRFLSVFHGNVYRSVYFLQIFGGTQFLIIYRVIWVSDFNKALHTRVNNINFLFQSIYTTQSVSLILLLYDLFLQNKFAQS